MAAKTLVASASPSPSPSLDAASQAYLAVILVDGTAYEMAHNAGGGFCNPGAPLAQNKGCTPALNLRVVQALLKLQSDLAAMQPPPRWAQDDQAIRSNIPSAISALQSAAKAYNAGDSADFMAASESYVTAASPIQFALTDIDPSLAFG